MVDRTARDSIAIGKYVGLIDKFLEGEITAKTFEEQYLTTFKNEEHQFREDVFSILDTLFSEIDELDLANNTMACTARLQAVCRKLRTELKNIGVAP